MVCQIVCNVFLSFLVLLFQQYSWFYQTLHCWSKTVNGPLLCNVSTKPAAVTAATSVDMLNLRHFQQYFIGYITYTPTLLFLSEKLLKY
jgi:hypothetical protein